MRSPWGLRVRSVSTTPRKLLVHDVGGSREVSALDGRRPITPFPQDEAIYAGDSVHLRVLGGLRIGAAKRRASVHLRTTHKAMVVATGLAGLTLMEPLSTTLLLGALGTGVYYHLTKKWHLVIGRPRNPLDAGAAGPHDRHPSHDDMAFVLKTPETHPGDRHTVRYGQTVELHSRSSSMAVGHCHQHEPHLAPHGFLQLTRATDRIIRFQIVSPCGGNHDADVVCGSHMLLQVTTGPWSGKFLGREENLLTLTETATPLQIVRLGRRHTQERDAVKSPAPPNSAFTLRVLTYNVWLMPQILSKFNHKLSPRSIERAEAIPRTLEPLDVDIVIFCEAFCPVARRRLTTGMKENGFLFETKVVGERSVTAKKVINGGCFAMSKYPIEHYHEISFGSVAAGEDVMADKGALYFRLRVGDQCVHVFGTHLQAWETEAAHTARQQQLRNLRRFIDALDLPQDEAVLIVGDINVNRFSSRLPREYETMLRCLDAYDPDLTSTSPLYSFDPTTNRLAVAGPSSEGRNERVDYVLLSKRHRQPRKSHAEIVPIKWFDVTLGDDVGLGQDLSDHYPLLAELHF